MRPTAPPSPGKGMRSSFAGRKPLAAAIFLLLFLASEKKSERRDAAGKYVLDLERVFSLFGVRGIEGGGVWIE